MATLKGTDGPIYYEISGKGPPVVFIQGIGVVGECWRPQVTALANDYETLLFDNRGIGKSVPRTGIISVESMAEDVRALMDAVGWESAHVVGHSMGGVIAQQFALSHPRRTRSLSLMCTFGRGKDGARLTPWVLWMTLRTRLGTRRMRRRAFLDMLYPQEVLRLANQDELAKSVSALVGRDLADQPPILMKQVRALARHNSWNRLGELAGIPTWVLSGEHDPIALPRYGKMLADGIPQARFEVMPGTSHGVTIQKAQEISQRLEEFLGMVENRRTTVAR